MSVARSLERRLERLIEGVAGRVFSGRLHPSELAGKLAREADFARFDHPTGPATANHYLIQVNPRDLTLDPAELEEMLAEEMSRYTADEGLRLEGPTQVRIEASGAMAPGRATCTVEVVPGPPVPWASLVGRGETLAVGRNRAVIGRSADSDVVVPHDDVSRQHALIHRERGQVFLRDLGSANGTTVDGVRVGREPVVVEPGSTVTLAGHRYRLAVS
ncbi:MAG TPA: FhaA domain-containing protein [Acidimicrobiia bacterium]|nr:FhaA domain-containing protein [Acidimicrobiia bacterium]